MAGFQIGKKMSLNELWEKALSFGVLIAKVKDIISNSTNSASAETEQQKDNASSGNAATKETEEQKKSASSDITKTVQIIGINAASSIGAEIVATEADFIDEKIHVMFNLGELQNRSIDLSTISDADKKNKYGYFKQFAAPGYYIPKNLVLYSGEQFIGKLNGKNGGEDIYGDANNQTNMGVACELLHPKAFNYELSTTRELGVNIQDEYLEKCEKVNEIALVVQQTMRKLYKLSDDYEISCAEYGQLYYGVFYVGRYIGWHRGIDMNYNSTNEQPFYSIADGIIVGKGRYSLDVYIPNDNVTITYMHYIESTDVELTLGKRLKKGDKIAIQSCVGSKPSIHVHLEINKRSCYSIGTPINQQELQESLDKYYQDLKKESVDNERIILNVFSDSYDIQDEIKKFYNKQRETILLEKNLRFGNDIESCKLRYETLYNEAAIVYGSGQVLPTRKRSELLDALSQLVYLQEQSVTEVKKFDPDYSIKLSDLTSLYPYNLLKKWCVN